MIQLTRLNNRPLVVNSELIKFIENAPDTVITLTTGEKIVVLETATEVINRIVDFRRRLCECREAVPAMVGPTDPPGSGDPPSRPGEPWKSVDET